MALRPLMTTGAALISAGAIVAATPALFVPRDEVQVTPTASAHSLTVEQYKLLAVSLQGVYQVFFQGYGGFVTGDGSGDCTVAGAVCPDGFVGVPYYLSDQLLPLGPLDNIFFEEGFTGLAQAAAEAIAAAIDSVDPTGRLDLERRVTDFFEGGATQLIGNLLLDNLPQDGYAYGVTNAFFFGYGANFGFVGAFTYVIDAITQGTPTPDPRSAIPTTSPFGTQEVQETQDGQLQNLAGKVEEKQGSGPGVLNLPSATSLINVSTREFKPFGGLERLSAPSVAPPVVDPPVVDPPSVAPPVVDPPVVDPPVDQGGVDTGGDVVEGGTTSPVNGEELSQPQAPKVQLPKLPQRKVAPEPEEAPDKTKTGNKFEPTPILFENRAGGKDGGWMRKAWNDFKDGLAPKAKPAESGTQGAG